MYTSAPRKARVYDRLEGQERVEACRRRFAEVDAGAEALRPGAMVALNVDCDELLAARRRGSSGEQWSLATVSTDWSSRGCSGWHTHAGDYAVESLEPDCLFRVLRDGPRIALASVAANGQLLCASGSGDQLGLAACGSGGWSAAGACWEQQGGLICNSRWPNKVLAVRLLHITCLPTTQLQRVEEFYGGLMHEVHAEKAAAEKRAREVEEQRDAEAAEAMRLRHALQAAHAALEQQRLSLEAQAQPATAIPLLPAVCGPTDVGAQLCALQQQLESLAAEGGLPQVQQERARMSICLQTIKELTDLVRQSANATPSTSSAGGSPSSQPEPQMQAAELSDLSLGYSPGSEESEEGSPHSPSHVPHQEAAEREVRLRDYLGERPEQADPLDRVLQPPMVGVGAHTLDEPSRRVLQALTLAGNDRVDGTSTGDGSDNGSASATQGKGGSAPPTGRKRLPRNPLLASLSLAVSQLAAGSPRQADGMAQFIATPSTLHPAAHAPAPNLRASHPPPQPKRTSPLRASQPSKVRGRSSFLKRPPAAIEDLYRC